MPRKPSESTARRDKPAPARARATAAKSAAPAPMATEKSSSNIAERRDASPPETQSGLGEHGSKEQIAYRAYLKWLERGCPPGDGRRDWFEAEEEVRRETEPA